MIDPITFGVVTAGLDGLTQEMKSAVMRTAYSPIVNSGGDMSVGVADTSGRVVAQGRDIPAQLGALPYSLAAMLRDRHGTLGPGDVLIGNDPYLAGSNHVNDVCLVMPAYLDDELLGYVCTRTHWMDIGGATPGSFNARVSDMYAEGLRIPTVLAYRGYEPVADIWDLVMANVRAPSERMWDLRAGFAGCMVGERGLQRMARRFGAATLAEATAEAVAQTERRFRHCLEAVPDGDYGAVDWLEGDGWDEEPIRLEVEVRIRGSSAVVDWTGSAPQVRGGLNLALPSTGGVSIYALKTVLAPDVAANAGLWAPVELIAPEGTVVNPRPPAANQAGVAETQQRMADLLMLALAPAAPEAAVAGSHASAAVAIIDGPDPQPWRRDALGRERALFMDQSPGGSGARATKDGVTGIKVHTGNARAQSVEVLEFNLPVRVTRWEPVPDTGGPGRTRGGCAVMREWVALEDVNVTTLAERARVAPFGLFGGRAGGVGRYEVVDPDGTERPLPSKSPPTRVPAGSRYRLQAAGGGGIGDPFERDPAAVAADVAAGLVSRAGALRDYGVVVGDDGAVDVAATGSARRTGSAGHGNTDNHN